MALAVGSRRSTITTTIAAVASALAAMTVAIAVAGRSCSAEPPGPEATVRDLLHAAKTNDRDTIYELLSPATQARLEVEAKRATDLVGAVVRYSPKDLISVSNTPDVATPHAITVVESHGDRARILVISAIGDRSHLELVRVDGLWRVDMPYGD